MELLPPDPEAERDKPPGIRQHTNRGLTAFVLPTCYPRRFRVLIPLDNTTHNNTLAASEHVIAIVWWLKSAGAKAPWGQCDRRGGESHPGGFFEPLPA